MNKDQRIQELEAERLKLLREINDLEHRLNDRERRSEKRSHIEDRKPPHVMCKSIRDKLKKAGVIRVRELAFLLEMGYSEVRHALRYICEARVWKDGRWVMASWAAA